jgi:hypothetical protein
MIPIQHLNIPSHPYLLFFLKDPHRDILNQHQPLPYRRRILRPQTPLRVRRLNRVHREEVHKSSHVIVSDEVVVDVYVDEGEHLAQGEFLAGVVQLHGERH